MFQNRMPRAFFILRNHLQIFISLTVKRKIPYTYIVGYSEQDPQKEGEGRPKHFFSRGGESIYASFKQIPLCKFFLLSHKSYSKNKKTKTPGKASFINLVSNFFWHRCVWLDQGYSCNQRKTAF